MKKNYPFLTYSGTIPFIVSAFWLLLYGDNLSWPGAVKNIMCSYALVIAVFLAGAHWGQHLHLKGKWCSVLSILSNVIVLVLWLAFLLLPFKWLMAVFIVAFLVLLFIDYHLFKHDEITPDYFQTRCYATLIVIFTFILALVVA